MCFLLETVEELRKKVDSLMDVKKQMENLQNMVGGLITSTKFRDGMQFRDSNSGDRSAAVVNGGKSSPIGMDNKANLRVNAPQSTSTASSASFSGFLSALFGIGNKTTYDRVARKPPVVGSKVIEHSSIKACLKPKEFHIHLGNLDINTASDIIKDYIKKSNIPIRILECEIIRSKRIANLTIKATNKDKVFESDIWLGDVTVRPWKFSNRTIYDDQRNSDNLNGQN